MTNGAVEAKMREYAEARRVRWEVCSGNCDWPVGDGTCGYCAKERRLLNEALELVQ